MQLCGDCWPSDFELDKQQKMNSFMDGCALSTVYKILHTSVARKGKVVKSVV